MRMYAGPQLIEQNNPLRAVRVNSKTVNCTAQCSVIDISHHLLFYHVVVVVVAVIVVVMMICGVYDCFQIVTVKFYFVACCMPTAIEMILLKS
jgi:hypothetical protein